MIAVQREDVRAAFPDNAHLQSRVLQSYSDPSQTDLLHEIIVYTTKLQNEITNLKRSLSENQSSATTADSEPSSKKRKLLASDNGPSDGGRSDTSWMAGTASFTVKDVSFSLPCRKKLTLEVLDGGLGRGGFKGVVPSSGSAETGMSWSDVEQMICVPVPEKAQPSFNFVVIPKDWYDDSGPPSSGAVVWTVPATAPKNIEMGDADGAETYEKLLKQVFDKSLARVGKRVVCPDAREFVSGIVQAHRKEEKAWHVKAFRGSKDGYLYFLSTGILFGFKKPILYFPFHGIECISYHSVLQRTFNMTISGTGGEGQAQEYEFGMLDQADFEGVDRYVKGHGLHDNSRAEERKAKKFAANGVKKGNGGVEGGVKQEEVEEEEDEGELVKAERAIQDAEDEQEEDYDPGSEGESEGSGTEDEEDEEGDGGGGGGEEEDDDEVEGEEDVSEIKDEDDDEEEEER